MKGKHLAQTSGHIELIYPLGKDFNISDKCCCTEGWGVLTVPFLPLIPGSSVLLICVKSLGHHGRPGAQATALHILALGLWGNWSNSATGNMVLVSQDKSCAK